MGGTYVALAVILGASAAVGQGLLAICGRASWSWLSPAVGLAMLVAVCWGAVNLGGGPGAGIAMLAGLTVVLGAAAFLNRGASNARVAPIVACAVLLGAILLASLPFLIEGRFGILGTSLNPDMSQHLFALDHLIEGGEERLIAQGYPLGPHALVAAVTELGPSPVEGFGGLTLAVAVATALAPLALLDRLSPARQIVAALLVGFAYMSASYLIQGAFKETFQALMVLAFAIGLHQLAGGSLSGPAPARRWRLLGAVPLAALAIGSIYAYSFPGLAWIVGALGIWALAELCVARGLTPLRAALAPAALALGVLLVAVAPELGRIADFASFETFDPDGAGYGNLFPGHPISPLEALGIWPSGDFRLDPGAGFAPAIVFWLGGAVALLALAFGLRWWLRRGQRAVPAALAAAAALYLYALVAGTPYQEAKAIAIAAPLAMLISARALLAEAPTVRGLRGARLRSLAVPALMAAFAVPAAACSALALANGPVGPTEWGPGLIELRERGALGRSGEDGDDTLVLAPEEILVGERGEDLFLWELRGGNVCADVLADGPQEEGRAGIENVITYIGPDDFFVGRVAGDPEREPVCPFIADGARADPGDAE